MRYIINNTIKKLDIDVAYNVMSLASSWTKANVMLRVREDSKIIVYMVSGSKIQVPQWW